MKAADRQRLNEARNELAALDALIERPVYANEGSFGPAATEAQRHIGMALVWVEEMAWIAERDLKPKIGRPRKAA